MPFAVRLLALLVTLTSLLASVPARAQEVTGALRGGIYSDTDRTQIVRSLATVDAAFSGWHVSAKEAVDIVSSASIDVRTSPTLDAVTSASSLAMSDRRFETTVGTSYDDTRGHSLGLSVFHATERDYQSVGAGLSGSYDLFERNTTLLAGVSANWNWVTSIMTPTFAETMHSAAYSAGLAQVLSSGDALRLRYDGQLLSGYQASPYRTVRFGDWKATAQTTGRPRQGDGGGGGAIVFTNTIGSASGLAEKLPDQRVRHAAVAEWLHAFGDSVGLLAQARVSRDSWGVTAGTFGGDLRLASDGWLLRAGYRYYLQGAADFFQTKYMLAADNYANYTSDKELGEQRGHIATADVGYTIRDWPSAGQKSSLDLQVDVLHYDYPGFTLLPSRTSVYGALGLRIGF